MITIISGSYPTGHAFNSEDVRNVWFEMLKPYNADVIFSNLMNHIKTNQYPPSISQLIPQAEPVDANAEFNEVIRIVAHYGYYRQREALEEMTDAQREAVRAIGYDRICQNAPESLRREFITVYKPIETAVTVI